MDIELGNKSMFISLVSKEMNETKETVTAGREGKAVDIELGNISRSLFPSSAKK